jgi:hypothetical protein
MVVLAPDRVDDLILPELIVQIEPMRRRQLAQIIVPQL